MSLGFCYLFPYPHLASQAVSPTLAITWPQGFLGEE
jgi:hypothetical protein